MRSRGPVCARRRRVRRPACVAIRVCAGCRAEVLCPAARVSPRVAAPSAVCLGGCRAPIGGAVCRCVCVGCVPRCGFSPLPPPPRVSVFARLAALDVCVRIGCPSQGLCSRVCPLGCPFVCVCLRVVCLQGCVSVRPCQVPGGRGAAGAQRLVGPLCGSGGGEFAAPSVHVNCGGVLGGPWGRRPCLPLPGGWVGGDGQPVGGQMEG